MKRTSPRKLALEKEYLRVLARSDLARPRGMMCDVTTAVPTVADGCYCRRVISYDE